jgi:hypothetical protein
MKSAAPDKPIAKRDWVKARAKGRIQRLINKRILAMLKRNGLE